MTTTTASSLLNQERTILGPLTTTFSQPATCTWAAWDGNTNNLIMGWMGKTCVSGVLNGMTDPQDCWPGTTAGASFPSTNFHGWGFYSPGLVCPTGFTSACTATASGDADWALQFSLEAGETAVGCCPQGGFACTNYITDIGQACVRTYSSGESLTTATCSSNSALVPGLGTYPLTWVQTNTVDGSTVSGQPVVSTAGTWTVSALTVTASMIQINWRASDLDAVATSTGTSSATSTASSSGSASAASSSNDSVSSGTIAGAVVGSLLGVGLIAAAVFFIWRRRRRSTRRGVPSGIDGGVGGGGTALKPFSSDHNVNRNELEGSRPYPQELPDHQYMAELPAGHAGVELPSPSPRRATHGA